MAAIVVCTSSALGQPAEPPAPQPSQPYPYPYQYPYPYPYPYQYPYPYPYPYQYPYQYPPQPHQPAPERPRQPPEPELPDDRAARTTPFFDALVTMGVVEQRFGHAFDAGLQVGAFVGGRLRIAARGILFINPPEDDAQTSNFTDGWGDADSDSPNVLWGGAIGVAALRRSKFVLSPSLVFLRTDDTDYGSFLGVGIPFEWVMMGGTRIGFEVDVGRAFGGAAIQVCQTFPAAGTCVPGEERRVDRPAGTAFLLHFQIGWGLVPD